jgi:hypothetical protein
MNTLRNQYKQSFPLHHLAGEVRVQEAVAAIEPSLTKFAFQLRKARRKQAQPEVLAKPPGR